MRHRWVTLLAMFAMLFTSGAAHAHDPGAGLGELVFILAVILAVALAIVPLIGLLVAIVFAALDRNRRTVLRATLIGAFIAGLLVLATALKWAAGFHPETGDLPLPKWFLSDLGSWVGGLFTAWGAAVGAGLGYAVGILVTRLPARRGGPAG